MALVITAAPVCSTSRPLVRVPVAMELNIRSADTPAVSWFSIVKEVGVVKFARVKIIFLASVVAMVLPEAAL